MDGRIAIEMIQFFNELSNKNKTSKAEKEQIKAFTDYLEKYKERQEIRDKRNEYGLKYSYESFSPSVEISRVINGLANCIPLYNGAKETQTKLESATQDILHALELCDLTSEKEQELLQELKEIRRMRRNCKNFIELVEPLKNYASSKQNIIKDLGNIHSKISETQKALEKRKYYPRVKLDLCGLFDNDIEQGNVTTPFDHEENTGNSEKNESISA